jgi:peptide-methionine (S)-S-oxide reductase
MNNNNNNNKTEIATLANGCFWCTEAIFGRVKGVKSILPGYAGGTVKHP